MKLIFLMSFLIVSCGNPHISSKEPPQQMVSPISPDPDEDYCQEQQQQQQQQQEDYDLLTEEQILKLKKCKENEVVVDKAETKASWTFDKPQLAFGTKMPFQSKAKLQLKNCKEEILKEFDLEGNEKHIGYSTASQEVCGVEITKENL